MFEGEPDHLVPSTSEALVGGDVFAVVGRMVGHSFLHGGPSLPGISPAVLHVLFGGSPESAPVTLEDCPDMDIRDSIALVRQSVPLSMAFQKLFQVRFLRCSLIPIKKFKLHVLKV